MIVMAITLVIVNEFGTATNVDMTAAANYRDQMRSHFLARSASNFGELVIRIQQRLDNTHIPGMPGSLGQQVQITDYADMLVQPFCGSAEEVRGAVGNEIAARSKGLGGEVGTCGFDGGFMTEDNKLNINCANAGTDQAATLFSALYSLVFFPAYDPVFEDADADGWRRDRITQVEAMLDYVDADTMHMMWSGGSAKAQNARGTSEDYGYENLSDRYFPRDSTIGHHTGNYIDTIGELRLVRGIDDRFWTLFGNAFTVYGSCKMNIAQVTNPQLIAAVLALSAKNPSDPVVLDPRRLFLLASYVGKARQFGEIFVTLDDFVRYVKDPAASVGSLASQSGTMAGSAASAAMSAGLPGLQPGEKLGLELDPKLLATIAYAGSRRTYRVSAYGEIQRAAIAKDGSPVFPPIRSTVTGVWDTKVVPQNVRKPPVPNGAWVFQKEE